MVSPILTENSIRTEFEQRQEPVSTRCDEGRRPQDGLRGYRTDQRAKDDNADRNASRPGTCAVNRKTLDFSPLLEFSIGTGVGCLDEEG